jgi:hypothetical protein
MIAHTSINKHTQKPARDDATREARTAAKARHRKLQLSGPLELSSRDLITLGVRSRLDDNLSLLVFTL